MIHAPGIYSKSIPISSQWNVNILTCCKHCDLHNQKLHFWILVFKTSYHRSSHIIQYTFARVWNACERYLGAELYCTWLTLYLWPQAFAIELVTFAVDFVSLVVEFGVVFVLLAVEFIVLALSFFVLAMELVAFAIELRCVCFRIRQSKIDNWGKHGSKM